MRKKFYWRFSRKIKGEFLIFYKRYPWGKKIKWKKFLKGFLWKIEAGGKNLKGFPFKFTPWLVLHVLHFIGDFFYKPPRQSCTCCIQKGFPSCQKWVCKGKFKGISFKTFFDPRYRPPTPVLVKVKKVKKKIERKKGLLYRILNLPRPPRPVLVQVGTTLDSCRVNPRSSERCGYVDSCKVNRLGRYYPGLLQS